MTKHHQLPVTCPKCGAKPTEFCTTNSGKESYDSHSARFKVFQQYNLNKDKNRMDTYTYPSELMFNDVD